MFLVVKCIHYYAILLSVGKLPQIKLILILKFNNCFDMIARKSLEKVDRIYQDLPRSAGICQKRTPAFFLSVYFG